MKYIIDEEELINIYTDGYNVDATKALINQMVDADILSPVEVIAEGEVKDNSLLPGVVSYKVGDIDDLKIFYNIYNRQNKNIKIYIEVIK